MKVYVPITPDGQVDPRWGRADRDAVAEVVESEVRDWQEFDVSGGSLYDEGTEAAHHARVARFLRDNQVDATAAHHVGAALAADADTARPSWAFLAALGLIGGGLTFVGAAVGHGFTSKPVSVVFLTLAAGSILYVITQLITVAAKAKRTRPARLRPPRGPACRRCHRRGRHRRRRLKAANSRCAAKC
jgi:hypothetical protein